MYALMQAMGLAPKDAEQAMMDAAAAVDEIVEAAAQAQHPVEQLGDALFDMNGKLDPNNESARQLHERLAVIDRAQKTITDLSGHEPGHEGAGP